jgi:RNA polymerase sigma-70 factor, ECF subfamily
MRNMQELSIESLYHAYKPLLFSIAYRMLGTVHDAEDIVHDIFITVQTKDILQVDNIKAYLCKIAANRSIDTLRELKKQRALYTGPWLPDPLITEEGHNPLHAVEREDSITYAMLVALEDFTPIERAVFILREMFTYDYKEIGEIIGKSETNCRKIFSRSSHKLIPVSDSQPVTAAALQQFAQIVLYAAQTGNMEGFISLLSEDIRLYTDGGGKISAALRPIYYPERVSAFFISLIKKYSSSLPAEGTQPLTLTAVNGQPAIIFQMDGMPNMMILHMSEKKVVDIYVMRNPERLLPLLSH